MLTFEGEALKPAQSYQKQICSPDRGNDASADINAHELHSETCARYSSASRGCIGKGIQQTPYIGSTDRGTPPQGQGPWWFSWFSVVSVVFPGFLYLLVLYHFLGFPCFSESVVLYQWFS